MDYFGLTDYEDFGYDYEREVLMERVSYLKKELGAIDKVFSNHVEESADPSVYDKGFKEWKRRLEWFEWFLGIASSSIRLSDRTVNKKKFMMDKYSEDEKIEAFFKKLVPPRADQELSDDFNLMMVAHNMSDLVYGTGWIMTSHMILDFAETELNKRDYPDVRNAVESVVGKGVEDFEVELTKEREKRHSRH